MLIMGSVTLTGAGDPTLFPSVNSFSKWENERKTNRLREKTNLRSVLRQCAIDMQDKANSNAEARLKAIDLLEKADEAKMEKWAIAAKEEAIAAKATAAAMTRLILSIDKCVSPMWVLRFRRRQWHCSYAESRFRILK